MLVLPRHLRHPFRDISVCFVHRYEPILVGIRVSSKSFEEIIGKNAVAQLFPFLADFSGLAGAKHDAPLPFRKACQEVVGDDRATRSRGKRSTRRRAAIAGITDENN